MPTDSIEKYATKLRELLRRIDPENHLEERYRVSYFIKGLQPTYKFHVITRQSATLEEAINSAKQYEDGCQQVAQQMNLFNPLVQPAQNDEISQLKSQLDSLKKQLKDQQRNTQQPPRTPRPIAQLKCYTCGRTGHIAANCRSTTRPVPLSRPSPPTRIIKCFNCGEEGHISPRCPNPEKFGNQCTGNYTQHQSNFSRRNQRPRYFMEQEELEDEYYFGEEKKPEESNQQKCR